MRFNVLSVELSKWTTCSVQKDFCAKEFKDVLHLSFYLTYWPHVLVRSSICPELGFVEFDQYGCICIFLHVVIQLDQYHLWRLISNIQCGVLVSLP